ncbi:putative transmembrane protein [Sinorhizobium fredii USDA 257]|uniref:Putative transmembrane protein n=2 Tax=Rhizobium fredii TaxID=380 RepID=I3XB63_SINF2|nr:putative transmembrane protein [Sinorhizobium fredii USDA 257]
MIVGYGRETNRNQCLECRVMIAFVPALAFAAVVGSGLMAGLFFVFSVCVMQALSRLPPEEGIAAMNAINVVIQNPLFLAAFMGTALLGLALIVAAFVWGGEGSYLLAAGGLAYIVGTLMVTIVFNVPLNDALAAARGEAAVEIWQQRYLTDWVWWNHVRTIASIGALALLVLGYARS